MDVPRSPEAWGIGIDVGGTKIAGGAVELRSGTVAFRRETPTLPERGGAAVLADIETLGETIAGALRRDGRDPGTEQGAWDQEHPRAAG